MEERPRCLPHSFLRLLGDEASRDSAIRALGDTRMEEEVEESLSFVDFAARESGRTFIRVTPPGHEDAAAAAADVEDTALAPRTQVVIHNLVSGLNEFFKRDVCPKSLTVNHIKIGSISLTPNFYRLKFMTKTPDLVHKTLKKLAKLLEKYLLRRSSLPLEVRHLLQIMKNPKAVALLPLIIVHPCLVPFQNRTDYFGRMFTYVRDVLQRVNKPGYEYIMKNLSFDRDWGDKIRFNKHLNDFFHSPPADQKYYPKGCPARQGTVERTPAKEAARFHRNMPEHGLTVAVHAGCAHGMLFNRTDMGQMLYMIMALILCSMAECLQRLNQFTHLELQSLFPGKALDRES